MADNDEGAPLCWIRTDVARVLGDLERGMSTGRSPRASTRDLPSRWSAMARALLARTGFDTVALSGGCFQNAVLLEQTERRLREAGFAVLTHRTVPANDGGLALGQAAVAAARLMA